MKSSRKLNKFWTKTCKRNKKPSNLKIKIGTAIWIKAEITLMTGNIKRIKRSTSTVVVAGVEVEAPARARIGERY